MTRRQALLIPLAVAAPGLWAQRQMSVDQMVAFVKSSLQLKLRDDKIADYLGKIKLDHQLQERVIEDLQGIGVGPKTLSALKQLREDSLNLPVPPVATQQATAVQLAGPTSIEQARIIDKTREYALDYTKQLPDFLCAQVTRRYYDPAGVESWHSAGTIVTKLSFVSGREEYKVISVNNQAVFNKGLEDLGGTVSQGEFGSMMQEIFARSTEARFDWERWATLRGRRMHVFRYQVAQSRSKYRISYGRTDEIVAGYTGSIYVDRELGVISRITLDADQLPPTFPLQEVHTLLDYDFQQIAGREYIVPLRAEIRSRAGKYLSKNVIEFRLYQKFGVDTSLTFDDTPEALPDEKTKETPVSKP